MVNINSFLKEANKNELKKQYNSKEKLSYLNENPIILKFLIKNNFKASQYAQITKTANWKIKLNYLVKVYELDLKNRGFTACDITTLVRGNNWGYKLVYARENFEKEFKSKGFETQDYADIMVGSDFLDKIEFVKNDWKEFSSKGFTTKNFSLLSITSNWKKNMNYAVKNQEHLNKIGLTNDNVALILSSINGRLKLNILLSSFLNSKKSDFKGSDYARLLKGKYWDEKLFMIPTTYENELKPTGFTPYHFTKLLRNSDYENLIDYVVENKDKIKKHKLKSQDVAYICVGPFWKDKLELYFTDVGKKLKKYGFKTTD